VYPGGLELVNLRMCYLQLHSRPFLVSIVKRINSHYSNSCEMTMPVIYVSIHTNLSYITCLFIVSFISTDNNGLLTNHSFLSHIFVSSVVSYFFISGMTYCLYYCTAKVIEITMCNNLCETLVLFCIMLTNKKKKRLNLTQCIIFCEM